MSHGASQWPAPLRLRRGKSEQTETSFFNKKRKKTCRDAVRRDSCLSIQTRIVRVIDEPPTIDAQRSRDRRVLILSLIILFSARYLMSMLIHAEDHENEAADVVDGSLLLRADDDVHVCLPLK